MNKLLIPAILVGTVLIAGAFALMPINYAVTVHDQVIGSSTDLVSIATTPAGFGWDATSTLTISSDQPYQVRTVYCEVTDTNANVVHATWAVTINGVIVLNDNNFDNVFEPTSNTASQELEILGIFVDADGGDDVHIDINLSVGANGDESIDCTVLMQTSADATVGAAWT